MAENTDAAVSSTSQGSQPQAAPVFVPTIPSQSHLLAAMQLLRIPYTASVFSQVAQSMTAPSSDAQERPTAHSPPPADVVSHEPAEPTTKPTAKRKRRSNSRTGPWDEKELRTLIDVVKAIQNIQTANPEFAKLTKTYIFYEIIPQLMLEKTGLIRLSVGETMPVDPSQKKRPRKASSNIYYKKWNEVCRWGADWRTTAPAMFDVHRTNATASDVAALDEALQRRRMMTPLQLMVGQYYCSLFPANVRLNDNLDFDDFNDDDAAGSDGDDVSIESVADEPLTFASAAVSSIAAALAPAPAATSSSSTPEAQTLEILNLLRQQHEEILKRRRIEQRERLHEARSFHHDVVGAIDRLAASIDNSNKQMAEFMREFVRK